MHNQNETVLGHYKGVLVAVSKNYFYDKEMKLFFYFYVAISGWISLYIQIVSNDKCNNGIKREYASGELSIINMP